MEGKLCLVFSLSLILLLVGPTPDPVRGYENYTVGGSTGWFDSLEKPGVDYQKWADSKSFSLGDFLIFNTDNNHSVVQTYNFTTFKLCDYNNALDKDTIEWSEADPSATEPHPVSVPVPLVKEGPNYFFSGNYDGEQCQFGQRFQVNVTHGQGLPKSLKSPSPEDEAPAPGDPQSGSEDDPDAAPDTVVPANFDHPRNVTSDDDEEDGETKESSGAGSSLFSLDNLDRTLSMVVVISVALLYLF